MEEPTEKSETVTNQRPVSSSRPMRRLYLPDERELLLVEEDGDLLNLSAGPNDLLHNLETRVR